MSPRSQRVVLITGSSPGGLGHAICKEFRAKGFRVFATSRKLESIKALEAEGCDILVLDVTKSESIAAAAQELSIKTGGRLDILVNNAGVSSVSPSITEDPTAMRSVIETNLIGPMLIGQAFIPLIIKSNGGKAGVIVNVTSIQAVAAMPWMGSYAASKAGLRSLSSTWRMELKNFGIRVVDVVGGSFKTKFTENYVAPPEASGSAHYWNWEEINALRHKVFSDGTEKSVTPVDGARDIVAAATKSKPPATIYVGSGAWLARYVPHFPLPWFESLFGGHLGASLVSYRP